MKINNQKSEKAFGRTVLTIEIEQKGKTPSRFELQETIAKKQNVKPELIVLSKIKPAVGTSTIEVTAEIYDNDASFKRFVPSFLKKRLTKKATEESA